MRTVLDFSKMKNRNEKISMITCYDYSSAKLVDKTDIDMILIGDSVAMVMYGYDSTLAADTDMIARHVEMVRRGSDKFIVADMPFLSFRKGVECAMDCVQKLMTAGANAVKIEGLDGHEEIIKHIVQSGIPVMGHLGLMPQSVNALGGFKVQGKSEDAKDKLIADAKKLQELGAFSVVLECVPSEIAGRVTSSIQIPTVGIGAGNRTDGQVLVYQDMLGITSGYTPKFVRKFFDGETAIISSINNYNLGVKEGEFPSAVECYL